MTEVFLPYLLGMVTAAAILVIWEAVVSLRRWPKRERPPRCWWIEEDGDDARPDGNKTR